MMHKPIRGQGALEYLLLIGGAILVVTTVLLITFGSTTTTTNIINGEIQGFTNQVSLNAFDWGPGGGGPGPGPTCGNDILNSGEQCDTVSGGGFQFQGGNADCSAWGAYLPGTNVGCNAPTSCTVITSACTPSGGGPSLPSATLTMVDGSVPLAIDIGYTVTSGYESSYNYAFAFDETDFSPISTVSAFDALYANPSTFLAFPWPSGAQTFPSTAMPNFVAGVTYFGIMKVCNSAGCAVSNITSAKAGSSTQFANFQVVSGPTNIGGGTADYSFSWTGNTCAAGSGSGGSAVVLAASVLFPTGSQTVGAIDSFNFNISDESSPGIYQFVPTAGSSSGRATNSVLKLAAFSGETNPTFGIACVDNAVSNYLLQSDVVSGTYPIDTQGPAAPSLSPTPGATNGGLVNLSWSSVADEYLGNVIFNSLVDDAASYIVAYKSGSAFSSALDFDAAVTAGHSKTIAGASSPGTPMSSSFNYGDGLVPSQPYYFGIRALDTVDGKTTLTANQTDVYVPTSTNASKEAFTFEAESANLGLQLGTIVANPDGSGNKTFVYIPGTCSAPNSNLEMTYTVDILAPSTENSTPFKVWVLGYSTTGTSTAVASIDEPTPALVNVPNIGTYGWYTNTAGNILVGGNLNSVARVRIPCSQPNLRIDKVLYTTNVSCVPTGDGSNCT